MRQGSNNRRSRGRNNSRRSGVPNKNQTFESSGPETNMRIRGNASQVHEKYMSLARDAMNAGERILAENFFQHAEHYYRVVAGINEAQTQTNEQQNQRANDSAEENWSTGQQNGAANPRPPRGRPNGEHSDPVPQSGDGANFGADPREAEDGDAKNRPRRAPRDLEANGAAESPEEPEGEAITIERQARPRRRNTSRARRTKAPASETASAEATPEIAGSDSD